MNTKHINDENYILIQGWMRTEIGLSGAALMVYATIYGFSQTGNCYYSGSIDYLAEWAGVQRRQVMRILKEFTEAGYIEKTEAGYNRFRYRTDQEMVRNAHRRWCHNDTIDGDIMTPDGDIMTPDGDIMTPNNIDIYNKDYIINDNIDKKNITKKETEIFDYWNDRNIIVHQKLTEPILTAIKKALKTYSVEEIETAIDRYDMILKDKDYFFSYIWSLKEFLNRQKGIADFLDDGEKWLNYSKVRVSEQKNKNKQNDIIRNVMQKLGEN